MEKWTKRQYMKAFLEVSSEGHELTERLHKLVDENRVTSGCLLTYGCWIISNAYDKLSNLIGKSSTLRKTPIDMIRFWFECVKQDVEKLRRFVEEQESLPFEETQKQKLIRKGDLKK